MGLCSLFQYEVIPLRFHCITDCCKPHLFLRVLFWQKSLHCHWQQHGAEDKRRGGGPSELRNSFLTLFTIVVGINQSVRLMRWTFVKRTVVKLTKRENSLKKETVGVRRKVILPKEMQVR